MQIYTAIEAQNSQTLYWCSQLHSCFSFVIRVPYSVWLRYSFCSSRIKHTFMYIFYSWPFLKDNQTLSLESLHDDLGRVFHLITIVKQNLYVYVWSSCYHGGICFKVSCLLSLNWIYDLPCIRNNICFVNFVTKGSQQCLMDHQVDSQKYIIYTTTIHFLITNNICL